MNRNLKIESNSNQNFINADIYSVVEAVNSSISEGEEKLVPLIVKYILEAHKAEFLN